MRTIVTPILMWAPTADNRQISPDGLLLPIRCPVRLPGTLYDTKLFHVAGSARLFERTDYGVIATVDLRDDVADLIQHGEFTVYPQPTFLEDALFFEPTEEGGVTVMAFGRLADIYIGLETAWDTPSINDALKAGTQTRCSWSTELH